MKSGSLQVDAGALRLIGCLEDAGYEAYVVGGCVRDAILGIEPNDWDICTSALPEQVISLARSCDFSVFETGIAHGTVSVHIDHASYEVTTYRSDGSYTDGRHPDQVTFLTSIEGDLARRDFTVNAMAYHPERGLVDPYGGRADLGTGLLRAVGEPRRRFEEDGLRIIRALRFASTYGFAIEAATSTAIHAQRQLLDRVAMERISVEFLKLLCGKDVERILMEYRDVIAVFLPQVEPMFDLPQYTRYHAYDVWEHSVRACGFAEPEPTARLAALIHDVGKPACGYVDEAGVSHFHNHPSVGADIARDICRHLKLPKAQCAVVETLVRYHDSRYSWVMHHIPEAILQLGEEQVRQVFALMRADLLAHSELGRDEGLERVAAAEAKLEQALREMQAFSLHDLAISGNDLREAGIEAGPVYGRVLNEALNRVARGELPNDKQALLAWAVAFSAQAR